MVRTRLVFLLHSDLVEQCYPLGLFRPFHTASGVSSPVHDFRVLLWIWYLLGLLNYLMHIFSWSSFDVFIVLVCVAL
jgi:hypothetical protein